MALTSRVLSVIAFHEKAGRSQVVSLSFLFVTRFFSAEKNFSIYWGRFQPDEKRCQKCGHYAYHPQEKKTDVNIATQLICDAFHDRFDTALIVSGDADLVPPVDAVRDLFPKKRIVAAFPPERYSSELAGRAHAFMNIHENSIRRCRLPEHIDLPNGLHVDCPFKWK